MKKEKCANGYFSVEAALVLPVVLGVYLFLMAILFLQYDRCMLEQDMASMLIKASNHETTPQRQLEYLQELTAAWDREQYLWLRPEVPHFVIRGQQIHLEAAGEYVMPISYGSLGNIVGTHRMKVVFQLNTWDRAALVRMLAGGFDREQEREKSSNE